MLEGKINHSLANILILTLTLVLSFTLTPTDSRANDPSCDMGRLLKEKIKLPPGFKIDLFADNVPGARSLTLGEKDPATVFVGTLQQGMVYALINKDPSQRAASTEKFIVAQGLNMPNGVAFRKGDLYVGEVSRILRYPNIQSKLKDPPKPEIFYDQYPNKTHHGWKFIAWGPDDKLYVPVGAPCNVCESTDPVFASLTRLDATGKKMEIVAHGIRNTVGLDWHPQTGELWFTDNGRDWLGDDVPGDELNRIRPKLVRPHFGFPYCHGGELPDPQLGGKKKCLDFVPPEAKMGAHLATLGMRFYTGKMFPETYHHQIFIAEHGSWNSSSKVGYRLEQVMLKGNGDVEGHVPFAEGWLDQKTQQVCGRPVDVLTMPDGALLVSDDFRGVVYRISYEAKLDGAVSPKKDVKN